MLTHEKKRAVVTVRLSGELDHMQTARLRRELDELGRERDLLLREQSVHLARQKALRRQKYEAAQAALEQAQAETDALRAELTRHGPPPNRERLRQAQEDLNYLNTLKSNAQLAQRQLGEAEEAEQKKAQELPWI